MRKTMLIARRELATTLQRRSFLLLTLGVPVVAIVVMAGLSLIRDKSGGGSGGGDGTRWSWPAVEGYVDRGGLIQAIPRQVPASRLRAYPGEAQAQEALARGEITAYYVIPADYVEKGELFYVYPDSRPLTDDGQAWVMVATLSANLVGDEKLAERVWNPVDLEVFDLGAGAQGGGGTPSLWVRVFPALLAVLLFAAFMVSATHLSESVAGEKENRTIEVLMLSASPVQILAGKVAGQGTAALIQTIAWLGAVLGAATMGGRGMGLAAESPFPSSLLAWGVLFFLLGFAQYASLMAGAGALVSRLKEVNQVSYLVLSPLMAGYLVAILAPMAGAAQRALPVALSFFPLTAPVVMVMRLAAGPVPAWQVLVSAGLMAASAYLILRVVAALFRAQTLLSGQPFSARRFLAALAGRPR